MSRAERNALFLIALLLAAAGGLALGIWFGLRITEGLEVEGIRTTTTTIRTVLAPSP